MENKETKLSQNMEKNNKEVNKMTEKMRDVKVQRPELKIQEQRVFLGKTQESSD
jgi:uncharacterized membrane protein